MPARHRPPYPPVALRAIATNRRRGPQPVVRADTGVDPYTVTVGAGPCARLPRLVAGPVLASRRPVRFLQRRTPRLPRYDYRTPGAYFVTLVVHQRRCVLADVVGHRIVTNAAGGMVVETWNAIPEWYRGTTVDAVVVMPNHIHAILWIAASVSTNRTDAAADRLGLSDLLHRFKTLTTRRYIAGVRTCGWPSFEQRLWQRGFYDRVIRDDAELAAYREYIATNPLRWSLDREFPGSHT